MKEKPKTSIGFLLVAWFPASVQVIFAVLKLLGVIHWPWIWVLSPALLIMYVFIQVCCVIIGVAAVEIEQARVRQAKKGGTEFGENHR